MTPAQPPRARRTNGQRELDGRPLTPSIKTTNEGPSGGRHHLRMMGAIVGIRSQFNGVLTDGEFVPRAIAPEILTGRAV
jgi:hypothetical protein